MSSLLKTFLESTTREVLVLVDHTIPEFADSLDLPDNVELAPLGPGTPHLDSTYRVIVLAVPDRAALRRVASLLPRVGNARTIACYVQAAREPVMLVPRPEWPPLRSLAAKTSRDGEALTVLRLVGAVSALTVLSEFARNAAWEHTRGSGSLVIGLAGAPSDQLPVLDLGTRVGDSPADVTGEALEVPPDVVLTAAPSEPLPEHPVLGRAPLVMDTSNDVPPVDELIINPIGFDRAAKEPIAPLEPVPDTAKFRIGEVVIDGRAGLSDALVSELRPLRGVELAWPQDPDLGLTRIVAGLAMAGIPLKGATAPDWARERLGARLADVLIGPVDLSKGLTREEHSVRLRRAALETHSSLAWRARLAAAARVSFTSYPSVSVVLATKRPHQLEFALKQVRKQRGVEVELVLATHGFEAEPERVHELVGDLTVVLQSHPASTLFGDVLTAAAHAASGDLLLKMDDDDWYGPDAVKDLLHARQYSGAEVVGMPAEFTYLQPVDQMIRRNDNSEFYARFVAGGTIMIDRGLLRSVGWFRSVRRYVDLQLLTAVTAAGGSIYRTHGLGYVMRRTADGHTWDPGLDYFLDEDRVGRTWQGFQPSALLEYDASELPERAAPSDA
jgi:hypothetical protein